MNANDTTPQDELPKPGGVPSQCYKHQFPTHKLSKSERIRLRRQPNFQFGLKDAILLKIALIGSIVTTTTLVRTQHTSIYSILTLIVLDGIFITLFLLYLEKWLTPKKIK